VLPLAAGGLVLLFAAAVDRGVRVTQLLRINARVADWPSV
jgi:hypothetical protein